MGHFVVISQLIAWYERRPFTFKERKSSLVNVVFAYVFRANRSSIFRYSSYQFLDASSSISNKPFYRLSAHTFPSTLQAYSFHYLSPLYQVNKGTLPAHFCFYSITTLQVFYNSLAPSPPFPSPLLQRCSSVYWFPLGLCCMLGINLSYHVRKV